jgi:hypothetical protein
MNFAVSSVSLFVLIYTIGCHTVFSPMVACSLYLVSPFLLLWMVYSILKYGQAPKVTFAESFYEDYRVGGCQD